MPSCLAASANIHWAPPFSIFYEPSASDASTFYIILPDNRAITTTASGPTLIYTYLAAIVPFFPNNVRIKDALAKIHVFDDMAAEDAADAAAAATTT